MDGWCEGRATVRNIFGRMDGVKVETTVRGIIVENIKKNCIQMKFVWFCNVYIHIVE